MLKRFLIATLALLAAAAMAFGQTPATTLEQDVAMAAAACPQDIGKGATMDNVKLTDTAVELHSTMDMTAAQFASVKQAFDMMRPTLLQMFISDPSIKALCAKASARGLGLSNIIHCKNDPAVSADITFSAQELKDALK